MPGYYELLPVSPFAKIDDGRGSSYSIGDGYVLTGNYGDRITVTVATFPF